MRRNINVNYKSQWPIRQIVIGIVLFGSGFAVGYTARDIPALLQNSGGAAQSASAQDDPSWGPADAKVTIVEFAEFECPYCRQWYTNVYEKLYQTYSDRVRFVFRDYPLSFHANARPAAVAANCAGAQGRYWDYFKLLYGDSRGLGSSLYSTYAQEIGLNVSAFSSCLTGGQYDNEIDLDLKDAERLGVSGVPAFFVNSQFISGMQPFEVFQRAIEKELKQ
ncbi:MAG: thioredoxin domain-containing protein [Anaerolineales bacterium]|nr:thioredoxin domain-containing protein [Anaerolineales bacterium]